MTGIYTGLYQLYYKLHRSFYSLKVTIICFLRSSQIVLFNGKNNVVYPCCIGAIGRRAVF